MGEDDILQTDRVFRKRESTAEDNATSWKACGVRFGDVFRGANISANLCQAVSGLIDAGEGVDVSVSWALTRPSRETLSPVTVRFARSDSALLREAATLDRAAIIGGRLKPGVRRYAVCPSAGRRLKGVVSTP